MSSTPATETETQTLPLLVGLVLSALSGVLMALAMPTHADLGWGWIMDPDANRNLFQRG